MRVVLVLAVLLALVAAVSTPRPSESGRSDQNRSIAVTQLQPAVDESGRQRAADNGVAAEESLAADVMDGHGPLDDALVVPTQRHVAALAARSARHPFTDHVLPASAASNPPVEPPRG